MINVLWLDEMKVEINFHFALDNRQCFHANLPIALEAVAKLMPCM